MSELSAIQSQNISISAREMHYLDITYRKKPLLRDYLRTRILEPVYAGDFKQVSAFIVFIGYERSGHTLVGSILDAHPNMIIGHELDILYYLGKGFSKNQIYRLILESSRKAAGTNRATKGYSYAIDNQWQGRFQDLIILGDKRGGATSLRIKHNPSLFEKLVESIDVPIKFIHVVRNPFDNISTIAKRRNKQITKDWINFYFDQCAGVQYVKTHISENQLFEMHSEDLIADKLGSLQKLIQFTGLHASEAYLSTCSKLVYDNPKHSFDAASWTPESLQLVSELMQEYPFLQRYTMPSYLI